MRRSARLIAAAVTSGSLAVSGSASASDAGEAVRLRVTRAASAAECPDQRAVRDAVSARLGYEPFADGAPRELVVLFQRKDAELEATVQLFGPDGELRGEKALTSARGDCEELASATTLTISILLDPRTGLVPPRPPEREVTPEPPLPPPADRAPAPLPPDEPGWRLRITSSVSGSIGSAPRPAAGLLLGAGAERRGWSLGAELRIDLPSSDTSGALRARTALTAGNLVPCGHVWRAYLCGALTLGVLRGEVLGASPSRRETFHATLGPRAGVALPLAAWLALDAHVDGAFALTSTSLRVGDADVWTTPAVSGLAAIGLLGRFP
ncbi:MAG: hypothetical protein KF782_12725 [Labilithrix sp.]|nr:hypothetical protein [Labilithrix sp.]